MSELCIHVDLVSLVSLRTTFVLIGIHGGSSTGTEFMPSVGDGTVKSMLGGGT